MAMNWNLRYSLDTEILECPICTEPFSPPVYQCENGHIICSACCAKIKERNGYSNTSSCPSCAQPTGRIRCLAVEKMIESLQVSCKHAPYGCKQILPYNRTSEREAHENETCKDMPFACPHPDCAHEGPSSVSASHLADEHAVPRLQLPLGNPHASLKFQMSTTNDFTMLESSEDDGLLLLLHREHKPARGVDDVFFCTTIAGDSRVYHLKVKRRAGSALYSMETSAPRIYKGLHECKERLLIPVADGGGGSHLREYDVEVSIPLEYDVKVSIPLPPATTQKWWDAGWGERYAHNILVRKLLGV